VPKFVIQYEVRLSEGSYTVELDHEPSCTEAKRIIDDLSGAEICEHAGISPPEVEVYGIYEKKDKDG